MQNASTESLFTRFRRQRFAWAYALVFLTALSFCLTAAFAGGIVFSGTNTFDSLKTRVKLLVTPTSKMQIDSWALVEEDVFESSWQELETNNLTLEYESIPLGNYNGTGGSISEIASSIVFVTPKGRIGYLWNVEDGFSTAVKYLDIRVPMKLAAFEESQLATKPRFNRSWLRTTDTLIRQLDANLYEMYASYHRYDDECFSLAISRIQISVGEQQLEAPSPDWEPVFETKNCQKMKQKGNLYSGLRDGGRMAFNTDGKLLMTTGDFDHDGDNSPYSVSMDPESDLGKVLEIDVETGKVDIFASGMRNAQGLQVAADGRIFTTDHGPNGGDEINLVERDQNYGWPEVTLGMAYGWPRRDWVANEQQGRHEDSEYTSPIHAFLPSIGISSLVEINSPIFPEWNGDLWATSLKNQSLWRLRRHQDRIIYAERTEMPYRLRDIIQLKNGEVAVLTNSAERLLLIKPSNKDVPDARPSQNLTIAGYTAVRAVTAEESAELVTLGIHPGRATFEAKCSTCHAIESDEVIVGPSLLDIAGREVGSVEGFPYSDAMTDRNERWTEERIRKFLSDPDDGFSGSSMMTVSLTLPEYLHVSWWITNCTAGRDKPACHGDG